MNETEEYSDWRPVPEGFFQPASQEAESPYDQSLVGEFARLLLLLIAFPLLIWFICAIFTLQNGILSTLAAATLLASLCTARGSKILRIGLLALMTLNVLSIVVNADYVIAFGDKRPSGVPNRILFACLTVALLFEAGGWVAGCSKTTQAKLVAWSLFAIPAIIYIAGIPLAESVWDAIEGDAKKLGLRDPDWSFWHESAYRTSKFAIFGLFTYAGACIGSFLNVVACSVPRGEPIGFRDSRCLRCDSKICRADNLPIFSYINLGARCRNCNAPIPSQYLVAELVVAVIFGSLFLYQLVTGCSNVPSMRMSHEGILWVILYPKWPAIAIYFFHASFMSSILVLAIMELNRHSLKPVFAITMIAGFFLAPMLYWPIQPIPLTENFPVSVQISPWIEQVLRLATGGIVGAAMAFGSGAVYATCRSSSFRCAMILTGIVLGWQALLQITLLFALTWMSTQFLRKLRTVIQQRPTSVLLAVIMIHHPFWKTIATWWQ